MSYYVYAYLRKNTHLPYYIGKGKGKRAFSKYRKVPVPKDKNRIVILENNLTEIGALALERRYIEWYGREDLGTGILLNRTSGGDGCSGIIPWNKGKTGAQVMSDETKKKMSESHKGCPLSKNHRDAIGKGNKGKIVTEETKKKMVVSRNKNKEKWIQSLRKPKTKKSCEVCHKMVDAANFTRWGHGTNCQSICSNVNASL